MSSDVRRPSGLRTKGENNTKLESGGHDNQYEKDNRILELQGTG